MLFISFISLGDNDILTVKFLTIFVYNIKYHLLSNFKILKIKL